MNGTPLPERETFLGMVASLSHRGPDGEGIWQDFSLLLGHRRLSIMDLSEAGAQPMQRDACVVSYNGEIYNYPTLRAEMEAQGIRFSSRSDTEVLVRAYQLWGLRAVERLNGIFAFALWDKARGLLWLCRDRLGVKPLYYSLQNGLLRFASETKAILCDPNFVRQPARNSILSFLTYGYIPAPQSAFENVHQLAPGHQLVVERDSMQLRQYWHLSEAGEVQFSQTRALQEFSKNFMRAVQAQTMGDCEVGLFLSGGLDSAALAAVAGPSRVFCAGFREAGFDERKHARETADHLGLDYSEATLSPDWESHFLALSRHLDEPFADSSALALDQLSSWVASQVKVVLCGDGADEILGGYSTYQATQLAHLWRRLPAFVRQRLQRMIALLPVGTQQRYPVRQLLERFCLGSECGPGFDHASWRAQVFPQMRTHLIKSDWLSTFEPLEVYAHLCQKRLKHSSLLKSLLRADLHFYLPSDILAKTDRVCMRHGLEARVPFLDPQLVEFCLTLPDSMLIPGWAPHRRKSILRKFLAQRTGTPIAYRPKRGFNVPVSRLMQRELYPLLMDALGSEPFKSEGPMRWKAVENLAKQHRVGTVDAGHLLYSLLSLAVWWRTWVC